MKYVYNKLVRDRIPEIMINKGCKPVTRILNDEDYLNEAINSINENYGSIDNLLVNELGVDIKLLQDKYLDSN